MYANPYEVPIYVNPYEVPMYANPYGETNTNPKPDHEARVRSRLWLVRSEMWAGSKGTWPRS